MAYPILDFNAPKCLLKVVPVGYSFNSVGRLFSQRDSNPRPYIQWLCGEDATSAPHILFSFERTRQMVIGSVCTMTI